MRSPSDEGIRCEILSWAGVIRDARRLAWAVKDSGYAPDIAIAIGRGGYVPARILCDYLILDELTAVKVEHWRKAGEKRERAVAEVLLFNGFHFDIIEQKEESWYLRAEAYGEEINPEIHELLADVKGVSLHDFVVEKTANGWRASVILDV
jgi:hypothetical protein